MHFVLFIVHMSLFNSLPTSDVCCSPLQKVWTKIRLNKTLDLIWIQTDSDGIPESFFLKKVDLEKKQQTTKKKHAKLTLKVPNTTADDKFWDIFPNFRKK